MESLVYGSEAKAFVMSDDVFPSTDGFVHTKEVLNGWDLKNTFNYQNSALIPSPELIKQGIIELGFHGGLRGTSADKPMEVPVCEKISDGSMVTSHLFSQKALIQKQESGSKDSSSITDIEGHDPSFIDLKLGRLVDFKDVKDSKCPKDTRSSFSVTSSVPAKKIRSTCLNGQTPFCQVYGCNMDLSSSKDYHKRHKVCEVHSKTAKVIVNGIEQRFCQQCSRFHLLVEFDDGKRSCRKRLAGHNERRRKPQLDNHSRNGKLLQSYHGAGGRFMGASLPVRTSFLCPDIFPRSILHQVKYDNGDWSQNVKVVDDEIPSNVQPPMSAVTGQLFPKHFLPHNNLEKQFSLIYDVGIPLGNISYGCMNQIQQGSASSHLIINSGSNVQDFSGVTVACCAPSLLSSQSQTASSYSSATSMLQPLMFQCGQTQQTVTQFSDEPLSMISHASTGVASNKFPSGMNPAEDVQMGFLISNSSNAVDFKVQSNVIYQDSHLISKELLSPEHGNTINLLQLSSLLRSAEEQRLVLAKQECEVFSCPPIT